MNKEIGADPKRILELRSAEAANLRERVSKLVQDERLEEAYVLAEIADIAQSHLRWWEPGGKHAVDLRDGQKENEFESQEP